LEMMKVLDGKVDFGEYKTSGLVNDGVPIQKQTDIKFNDYESAFNQGKVRGSIPTDATITNVKDTNLYSTKGGIVGHSKLISYTSSTFGDDSVDLIDLVMKNGKAVGVIPDDVEYNGLSEIKSTDIKEGSVPKGVTVPDGTNVTGKDTYNLFVKSKQIPTDSEYYGVDENGNIQYSVNTMDINKGSLRYVINPKLEDITIDVKGDTPQEQAENLVDEIKETVDKKGIAEALKIYGKNAVTAIYPYAFEYALGEESGGASEFGWSQTEGGGFRRGTPSVPFGGGASEPKTSTATMTEEQVAEQNRIRGLSLKG